MASDRTNPVNVYEVWSRAANSSTAGSYTRDGAYNPGGWSTYPSREALALSSNQRASGNGSTSSTTRVH